MRASGVARGRDDWDGAARELGLQVTERAPMRNTPRVISGRIGDVAIRVARSEGGMSVSADLPSGPWDQHRITIQNRLFRGRSGGDRSYRTGDAAFDDRFVVRLHGPKGDRPAAHAWVDSFLTARRREALLDLRSRCKNLRLITGSPKLPAARLIYDVEALRLRPPPLVETVGAIVECTEVLVAGH